MSHAIVTALFSVGAGSVNAWRPILDDRVHIRIGNRQPAIGLAAAMAELEIFLARINCFGGGYRDVWELPDAILVETDIVCRAHASLVQTVPCALVFRLGDRALAQDVRFYLDPSALFG